MKYEVILPIDPPTATDQHVGHRIARVNGKQVILSYRKKPQKMAHALYEYELKRDISHRKDGIGTLRIFAGEPIIVKIDFMFPHPACTAKRDRNKVFARTVRPDVDNMAKGLLDCLMSVGLILDDASIFDLQLRKFNVPSNKRGVRITITNELSEYYESDGKEQN